VGEWRCTHDVVLFKVVVGVIVAVWVVVVGLVVETVAVVVGGGAKVAVCSLLGTGWWWLVLH